MSCLQLPSRLKQFATMRLKQSYRPLWLTSSNSFEFPNYTILHPNLNKQVALILYYAHVMDQKKLLKDFFRLCKDSFENKWEGEVLESAVKAWIKHSIVKLHRRRELIISNTVTTFQMEMICTISRILLSIFCDLLRESSDIACCCSLHDLRKKCTSGVGVTNQYGSSIFREEGVLLPRISISKDFSACRPGWEHLFLGLPLQEKKHLSVSTNHPIDWLHKFWLTFCYRPNPTNSIYNGDATIKTTSFNHTSQSYISRKMTVLNQTSENCITIKTTDLNQSGTAVQLTESNLRTHNNSFSCRINQAMSAHESFEDSSSIWSQKDSQSSGSWSLTDLADEMSEVCFNSDSMSPGLDQRNPTMLWLQSPSSDNSEADFDSDDESVIFGDVITEENCLERGGNNGSLYFIDTDDYDDFDVMFSETAAVVSFPMDTYEDKSQAYDNPCFEEVFISPRVLPQYIRNLNESWREMMLDIEDKPRQASKVSFAPEPNLVTIHCFQKTDDNSFDSSAILDRMRFQRRINELNHMLSPFLTCKHRREIERRNCFYQD